MVELNLIDVVIISSIFIPCLVVGSVIYLKKTKVNRSISKSNDNSILNHYNVLLNINEDQQSLIKSITQKTKMLQKKIMELEGYEEEKEEEKPIDITALLPFVEKIGIPKEQLELILQSDEAQKFLKKNKSMITNVLPLLTTFAKNKQNAQSQTTLSKDTA